MKSNVPAGAPVVDLHRAREGSGVPVILSHGLGDDASTWDELVPRLARGYEVVTWDLRGHGQSDAPLDAEAYSMEIAISDLLSVIAEVDASVHLVGHSLGGYLSLAVSLRRPELVRTLTLIGSGPGYRDPEAREGWNRMVDRAVVDMPIPAVAGRLAYQDDSRVIDGVSGLEPPLLVLVGERDTRFHAGCAFLARTVPGCVMQEIAGGGHHVQRNRADEVATAVLVHLERTP
jgi:pimeloyl-ACP methyl ester carboxylesterase